MPDKKNMVMIDGNTAAAYVAHALSECIAIYPITPSSPMGELADEYSAQGRKNIWGTVPQVVEMQSEAGASGTCHGALTAGALTTTFTASQGLLLMIPNMYKIAGECTSAVFHVAARALATHALSIYGDHQDVMAVRSTGWAMLCGDSVQEVMDMALVAHASTLEARVPFVNFFDGFRTSHEVAKVEEIPYEVMKEMINDELVRAHRARGLTPEHPMIRGTSQNPDVYFASREGSNKLYDAVPEIVEKNMEKLGKLIGRHYHLFDYVGPKDADRVVIVMGSGADVVQSTVDYLNKKGEKVGVLKVHLYRPFSAERFVKALPASVKKIAVLDRDKEQGADGEPLYKDVVTAITEMLEAGKAPFKAEPEIIGGRYGLGSAEFTPTMAKAVFDELKQKTPKNHFCVGPQDDVTFTSLDYDPEFTLETPGEVECLFYGLGSDGTVGANKNSIKIIGSDTPNYAQGYFFYDSKKAGSYTISHLRFGPQKIDKPYLIEKANFIACHKFAFLEKIDILKHAKQGATFLLNSPYTADKVWNEIPVEVQKAIIAKKIKFYVIDGMAIAAKAGMGTRINTIMQTAFFKISGVLPADEALEMIKKYTQKTYARKGADVVAKNIAAIDLAVTEVHEVKYPNEATSKLHMKSPVPADAPEFVKKILGPMIQNEGESLKVSELPMDGTFPTGTTQYERRNIAENIPVWNPEVCIQCGQCTMVCPHAVIRLKAYDPKYANGAPKTFKAAEAKGKEFAGMKATLQVAPEDCTGCGACVNICPAVDKANPGKKAINMQPQMPLRESEAENWEFFKKIPNTDHKLLNLATPKGIAMRQPLFEFSGCCAGCGETPYIKMMSQLFGDRALIANATGCSSIYGGNLPTTPYTKRADGRGPAWSNSLFEDAAEFGFGMRIAADKRQQYARELVEAHKDEIGAALADKILKNDQAGDEDIEAQRANVADLKKKISSVKDEWGKELENVAEDLIRKSVWTFGGDGWGYDIGYGGLDHVIASGRDINIMIVDTEVYSNTGGQMSKATPIGAIAKFAAAGKSIGKKDLGAMAMAYGYVYVAQVALGANMVQAIKAFREAESYHGPSLIICYSHCINQGLDMSKGMNQQKLAVESGVWPLYRYDPRLKDQGKNPFQLDSKEPDISKIETYVYNEVRFKSLKAANPERAAELLAKQKANVERRYKEYKYTADRPF